jgi:hypothetical protein
VAPDGKSDRLGGRAAEFRVDARCRWQSCGFAGRLGASRQAIAGGQAALLFAAKEQFVGRERSVARGSAVG